MPQSHIETSGAFRSGSAAVFPHVGVCLGEVLPAGPSVSHLQKSQLWDSSRGTNLVLLSLFPRVDEFGEFFFVAYES